MHAGSAWNKMGGEENSLRITAIRHDDLTPAVHVVCSELQCCIGSGDFDLNLFPIPSVDLFVVYLLRLIFICKLCIGIL